MRNSTSTNSATFIKRGLAYYTGIVFELFDARSSLRAICGGGRYDDLIKQVAGIDLPCVGFGMGDVVLGELLKEHGKQVEAPTELDAFLVAGGGGGGARPRRGPRGGPAPAGGGG